MCLCTKVQKLKTVRQFIQIKVKEINWNLELMFPILVIRMFIKQWYQELVDIPWEPTGHSTKEAGCPSADIFLSFLFSKSNPCSVPTL